jgi:hypothetical protein
LEWRSIPAEKGAVFAVGQNRHAIGEARVELRKRKRSTVSVRTR